MTKLHFDARRKGLLLLSFGAGQDSTTLLYKFILDKKFRDSMIRDRNLVLVFADTGDEREATYDHAWATFHLCLSYGIKFIHLASTETAKQHEAKGRQIGHLLTGYNQPSWTSLAGQYLRNHNLAIRRNKSCTDNLKIRPIYKWLDHFCDQLMENDGRSHNGKPHIVEYAERYGKIQVMIGFTAGEESRVKKAKKPGKQKWWNAIDKTFPLAEDLNMTRMDCIDYMQNSPFDVCPPSMCKMCPNITKHTLVVMWHEDRWSFIEWCRHERRKLKRWEEPLIENQRIHNLRIDARQRLKEKDLAFQNEDFKKLRNKSFKNSYALGGKYDLIGELRKALKDLSDLSLEEIKEHDFTHGHCISNGY